MKKRKLKDTTHKKLFPWERKEIKQRDKCRAGVEYKSVDTSIIDQLRFHVDSFSVTENNTIIKKMCQIKKTKDRIFIIMVRRIIL